jgi:small-conductance mechanosensitive channel
MAERRVLFSIGVTYGTPRAQVVEIPGIIRKVVEAQEKVRFDRSHFKEFGAYSLNFETVYWVLDPDYALYMDIQQRINLALMEIFQSQGIEFAFPTQTLFLEGGERPPLVAPASRSQWAAAADNGGDGAGI